MTSTGTHRVIAILAVVTCTIIVRPVCASMVVFVDSTAPPMGDGLSWSTARRDLQDALEQARSNPDVTAIWVAAGVYPPDAGTGDRERVFELVTGVALLGGFAGDEVSEEERDPATNVTTLSGDLAGDDGPDFANNGENAHQIVRAVGAGVFVIDGFTITGANGEPEFVSGAGLSATGGAVTMRRCRVVGNTTTGSGGGVAVSAAGTLELIGTEIAGNRAFNGGGLSAGGEEVVVRAVDCTLRDNLTIGDDPQPGSGGAVLAGFGSDTVFTRCDFENNEGLAGGAFSSVLAERVAFHDCTFVGNRSNRLGGAVRLDRSDNGAADDMPVVIAGCTFVGNRITGTGLPNGSALFMTETVSQITNTTFAGNETPNGSATVLIDLEDGHRMENCVFAANTAGGTGGLLLGRATVTMTNCTVTRNVTAAAIGRGGITVSAGGLLIVRNTILWGNARTVAGLPVRDELAQIGTVQGGQLSIDFSIIEGLTGGLGGVENLGDDPQFVSEQDIHLTATSPAIDAGDDAALPADIHDLDADGDRDEPVSTDIDGDPRVQGETVDIGADEIDACPTDLDDDGQTGFSDLIAVLAAWGPCDKDCPEDLDEDNDVDFDDLLLLLAAWGPCE